MSYNGFNRDQEEEIRRLARIEAKRVLRAWIKSLANRENEKIARIEKALDEGDEGDWDI